MWKKILRTIAFVNGVPQFDGAKFAARYGLKNKPPDHDFEACYELQPNGKYRLYIYVKDSVVLPNNPPIFEPSDLQGQGMDPNMVEPSS